MKSILVFLVGIFLLATVSCGNDFNPDDFEGDWYTVVHDDANQFADNYWWKNDPEISFEIKLKPGFRFTREFQVKNFSLSNGPNDERFFEGTEPAEVTFLSEGKLIFCLIGWDKYKNRSTIVVILNSHWDQAEISICSENRWTAWRTMYLNR